MDPTKHEGMILNLKNQSIQNSYTVDLASMYELATYWSSESNSYKTDIPASGVGFNTSGKSDNRKAGDKGQKRNVKDAKPDRKVDCWNCGGISNG